MGGFIGNWMDERWHGGGYYAIGGVVLGLVAGMFNLVLVSRQFMKNDGSPPEGKAG
jgi:F0F1-type ATP synthase assembly protein I